MFILPKKNRKKNFNQIFASIKFRFKNNFPYKTVYLKVVYFRRHKKK